MPTTANSQTLAAITSDDNEEHSDNILSGDSTDRQSGPGGNL